MMQKEFEELTGVIVSNSEYASIEREYMSCEDEKESSVKSGLRTVVLPCLQRIGSRKSKD